MKVFIFFISIFFLPNKVYSQVYSNNFHFDIGGGLSIPFFQSKDIENAGKYSIPKYGYTILSNLYYKGDSKVGLLVPLRFTSGEGVFKNYRKTVWNISLEEPGLRNVAIGSQTGNYHFSLSKYQYGVGLLYSISKKSRISLSFLYSKEVDSKIRYKFLQETNRIINNELGEYVDLVNPVFYIGEYEFKTTNRVSLSFEVNYSTKISDKSYLAISIIPQIGYSNVKDNRVDLLLVRNLK